MSGEVKRYQFICDIEDREYVEAEDHDRIVSELVEGGRKVQAERDQLVWQCKELEAALHSKEEFYQDALHSHVSLAKQRDQLAERVESLEATRKVELAATERLAERCRELEGIMLRTYKAAGMGAQDIKTAMEDCPLDIEVGGNIREAEKEAKALRAEVEQLKIRLAWVEPCEPNHEDVKRLVAALSYLGVSTPESMEEAAIRWLSLVRTLIRQASDSKLLRQDSEKLAEVDALRKDAERYRWARRPESGNVLFTLVGAGECGPNMDSAIDAAMEASR